MGVPGWPELACSTASMARVRMVLMLSSSRSVEAGARGVAVIDGKCTPRTVGGKAKALRPLPHAEHHVVDPHVGRFTYPDVERVLHPAQRAHDVRHDADLVRS